MGLEVMYSSETDRHDTPSWLVDRIADYFDPIDLDPCASSRDRQHVPAVVTYTAADDGLSLPWLPTVYLNPPYGREIGAWIAKLNSEYHARRVHEAICLLPARTDTVWWHDLRATTFCFLRGRLKFNDGAGSAPFPSVLAYYGPHAAAFTGAFCDLGLIYAPVVAKIARRAPKPLHEVFAADLDNHPDLLASAALSGF